MTNYEIEKRQNEILHLIDELGRKIKKPINKYSINEPLYIGS